MLRSAQAFRLALVTRASKMWAEGLQSRIAALGRVGSPSVSDGCTYSSINCLQVDLESIEKAWKRAASFFRPQRVRKISSSLIEDGSHQQTIEPCLARGKLSDGDGTMEWLWGWIGTRAKLGERGARAAYHLTGEPRITFLSSKYSNGSTNFSTEVISRL